MSTQSGTALLQSLSDAVAELAEKVSASVVSVGAGRGWGTGIVWSKEGHILTANHVVRRADALRVTLADGRQFDAKVVGRDPENDIALLKADGGDFVPILADGGDLRSGQLVFAFGNAAGHRTSVTSGIVTNPKRSIRGWWGVTVEDAVITDVQLNPGYSGGPLADAAGKLVGMNVAYFAARGVAVPVSALQDTVEKLLRDGKIRKGFLGIVTEQIELPEEISGRADVGQDEGLLVRAVENGTPAKTAGLTIGDILVKVAGAPVSDTVDLQRSLRGDVIGKALALRVLRGGQVIELSVAPAEAE